MKEAMVPAGTALEVSLILSISNLTPSHNNFTHTQTYVYIYLMKCNFSLQNLHLSVYDTELKILYLI